MKKISILMVVCILLSTLLTAVPAFAFPDAIRTFNIVNNAADNKVSGEVAYEDKTWTTAGTGAVAVGLTHTVENGVFGRLAADRSVKYFLPAGKTHKHKDTPGVATVRTTGSLQSLDGDAVSQASVYIPAVSTGSFIDVVVRNHATTGKDVKFTFKANGTISHTVQGGSETIFANAYKSNQWYTISSKFTKANSSANIYLDGQLICSNVAYSAAPAASTQLRMEIGITINGTPSSDAVIYFDDAKFFDLGNATPGTGATIADRNPDISSSSYTVRNSTYQSTGSQVESDISNVPFEATASTLIAGITPPAGGSLRVVSIDSAGVTTICDGADILGTIDDLKLVSVSKSGGMKIYDVILNEAVAVDETDAGIEKIIGKGLSFAKSEKIISVAPLTTVDQLLDSIFMDALGADAAVVDANGVEVTTGVVTGNMTIKTTSINGLVNDSYAIDILNTSIFSSVISTPESGNYWSKTGSAAASPGNTIGFAGIQHLSPIDGITATVTPVRSADGRIWASMKNATEGKTDGGNADIKSTLLLTVNPANNIAFDTTEMLVTEFTVKPMNATGLWARLIPQIMTTASSSRGYISNRSSDSSMTNEVYFDVDGKIKLRVNKSNGSPVTLIESYDVGAEYDFVIVETKTKSSETQWSIKYDNYINGVLEYTRTVTFNNEPLRYDRLDFMVSSATNGTEVEAQLTGFKQYGVNSFDIAIRNNPLRISEVKYVTNDATPVAVTSITTTAPILFKAKYNVELLLPVNEDYNFIAATGTYVGNKLFAVGAASESTLIDVRSTKGQTAGSVYTFDSNVTLPSTNTTSAVVKTFLIDSNTMKPLINPVILDSTGIR